MSARGLRDVIRAISPPWKRTGVFEKLDYAMASALDIVLDKGNQAIAARIPTRTRTTSSLALIGADRLIPQGITELASNYAQRLRRAFDDWFYAGSARGLLGQTVAFVSPVSPLSQTVTASSVWDLYADGAQLPVPPGTLGAPAHVVPNVGNWNWDGPSFSARWCRFWLILRDLGVVSGTSWVSKGPTCGSGKKCGDTSFSCGLSVPSSTIKSIRALVAQWKPANATCLWIIINFDATLFVATDAAGAGGLPDGSWGPWHKTVAGVAVPSRAANARYCDGIT